MAETISISCCRVLAEVLVTQTSRSRERSTSKREGAVVRDSKGRGFGCIPDNVYRILRECVRKDKSPTLSRDSPSFARDKAAYNYFQRNALRIEKIFSLCDAREIEALVLVHPFTGKRQIALWDADVNRIISW